MGGRLLTVAPPAELREPQDPVIADFLNPHIDVKNPRFKQLES
jgi:phospholipid/cholesterol/gamma-HCH transport system ATP-binding protein